METIKLKSPVDGSVYAERPVATDAQANAAVERARAAQPDWAALPVATRAGYMLKMLEALTAMSDEIVTELAWQMGRPVKYGGEFGGVKERVAYMVEIAERALAPVPRRAGPAPECTASTSAATSKSRPAATGTRWPTGALATRLSRGTQTTTE